MEDFTTTPPDPQPSSGVTPLSFALGLVAALVIGGVVGYGQEDLQVGLFEGALIGAVNQFDHAEDVVTRFQGGI